MDKVTLELDLIEIVYLIRSLKHLKSTLYISNKEDTDIDKEEINLLLGKLEPLSLNLIRKTLHE
jgi:hypothetical protein